ncbi:TetR/AcrR family transcriptional regulator [Antrihabitans cavernicola]|uniref:TetR/AcrR family transcriptional regulator n=1 Tax=Antrihabitans cavernicola TaxID=2495913 RepID=A0A5A7S8J0_9NOCA|nr:TetR/AcrR family transcriptional regulator [Spelaeibacter cavernicola]KAA0020096.1 TetR/AcrR family transcriptional regulator [Spelaeibacter cavernicola]
MSSTQFDIRSKGDRTRDAIRAAADECFREFGFDATGAEIARRAGVVEGTVFLHYRNKVGLLAAVTRDFYDLLQVEADAALAVPAEPVEKFRRLVDGWALRMETDWDLIAVFVQRAQIAPDSEIADVVRECSRRYTRLYVSAIDELKAARLVAPEMPSALIRDVIFGSLEHTARGRIAAGKPVRTRAVAAQVIDLLLAGAAPPAERDDRFAAIEAKLDEVLAKVTP